MRDPNGARSDRIRSNYDVEVFVDSVQDEGSLGEGGQVGAGEGFPAPGAPEEAWACGGTASCVRRVLRELSEDSKAITAEEIAVASTKVVYGFDLIRGFAPASG